MMKSMILAAGMGTRLRPLTERMPKCMVAANGKPIIQHQLEALETVGIQSCTIVVGYMAEYLRENIGYCFAGIDISYVENDIYDQTNNIYSLWMARDALDDDTILLEGDVLVGHNLIQDLTDTPHADAAVVDKFVPPMNGTVILPRDSMAASMVLKSHQAHDFDYTNALKTVNIYKFCGSTLINKVVPALDRYVSDGHTDIYYEAVISELVDKEDLYLAIQMANGHFWAEVDDVADLRVAEERLNAIK